jgi:hypothetical protein
LAEVVVRRPEVAAAPGVAEEARPQAAEAERVLAAVVLRQVAAEERALAAEVRPQAAGVVPVSEGPQRGDRDEAPAARLSAAAWAAPLSVRFQEDRLAPSPPARFAHARKALGIAQP